MTHNRDLDNSRRLDVHKWSEYPEVNAFVDTIWSDYIAKHITESDGRKQRQPTKGQFKVILLDLYVCHHEDPEQSLGTPMERKAYKQGRYNALHISQKTIDIVEYLKAEGLIGYHKGSESAGRVTRVWPTDKLIQLFNQSDLEPMMIVSHWKQECIVLNNRDELDDKSKPIEYKDADHPNIVKWRVNVKAYNKLLEQSYIDVYDLEKPFIIRERKVKGIKQTYRIRIDQNHKFTRRVFYRGSWELGGRFHGGFWQQIDEDMRSKILINESRTVEVDYSGMHVSLAYAIEGLDPVKDPYRLKLHLLDGFTADEQRKVVKGLVLMAINASTEKKAFTAFRSDQDTGTKAKKLNNKQLQQLLDQFRVEHQPIAHYLCSDMGVRLMSYDSEIAYEVVCHFTKRGIPILCVHDSFVIAQEYDHELRVQMDIAATNAVGKRIKLDSETLGASGTLAMNNLEPMDTGTNYQRLLTLSNKTKSIQRCHNYNQRLKQWMDWRSKHNMLL